jgi:copper chaperone CopZ
MEKMMKLLSHLSILFFCWACVGSEPKRMKKAADGSSISKTYYVKGMTCGGCIFSVVQALEKDAGKINFLKKDINVGTVKLIFEQEEYKGKATDCAVKNSIDSKTDYKVYLDHEYKNPAC